MSQYGHILLLTTLLLIPASEGISQDASSRPDIIEEEKMPPATVRQIAHSANDSIVEITVTGRDGKQYGLGTGFVISEDGLIATNLHVIGEARPISVQFADNSKYAATSIHTSDRALDLAVIRIDAKGLKPLKLGDSEKTTPGQRIIVLGNPHGLRHSVVSGVISNIREIEQRKMLQLAIPIEPGNSGGPVLDEHSRVLGLVTMKSLVNENLGFAVQVNDLKLLLEKPNPIPISNWLTIGTLDRKQWSTLFGANWQQRAGRILVSGTGNGFGGRSICLSSRELPKLPFELAVTVRLDDEAGAAGLAFFADGHNLHYGFYPSAGKLRLSRFDGPTVYQWNVLHEVKSDHYYPGRWNHLKVRLEKDKILCYVNDQLVIESKDRKLSSGRVGLAKFRQTKAEFKQFQIAEKIPPSQLSPEVVRRVQQNIAKLPDFSSRLDGQLNKLLADAPASMSVLRQQAKELDEKSQKLLRLAQDVHVAKVTSSLAILMQKKTEEIDLAKAALLIAKLDNEEVDIPGYLQEIDRMADEIARKLPQDADESKIIAALDRYLFKENGFHGSRTNYYHQANSHLSRVIDEREGLPITLSVLYMELGKRLKLKISGVGLPGRFVVRHYSDKDERLIDVYDQGKTLSRKDAAQIVLNGTGRSLREEHLKDSTKLEIVKRMIANLLGLVEGQEDKEAMLRYLEAMVAVDPEDAQYRGLRAVVRYQTGRRAAAVADLDWFLENKPAGIPLEEIRRMRRLFLSRP